MRNPVIYGAVIIGVYLFFKHEAKTGIKAVTESVSDTREAASNRLSDFFAWASGLKRHEDRIMNDPEYRKRYLAGRETD